jgi:hypothetical protein
MLFNLDTSTLFASLFWSAIGSGYWIYGKKQRTMPPLIGGIALIVVSCLIESAAIMSLVCVGIMVGVYFWSRYE